jgi:hypothetical protein
MCISTHTNSMHDRPERCSLLLWCTQGVLDARGRQSLSRIIFYVFIPSLTFTKLGASVDLHNMSRWWILPVNILIRCALACPGIVAQVFQLTSPESAYKACTAGHAKLHLGEGRLQEGMLAPHHHQQTTSCRFTSDAEATSVGPGVTPCFAAAS